MVVGTCFSLTPLSTLQEIEMRPLADDFQFHDGFLFCARAQPGWVCANLIFPPHEVHRFSFALKTRRSRRFNE
jgi:hypothetical protein